MQPHIKNYFTHYGYTDQSQILCEIFSTGAVELHHIDPRSNFGKNKRKEQDDISNLIALCRECHQKAHYQIKEYITKEELQILHNNNL